MPGMNGMLQAFQQVKASFSGAVSMVDTSRGIPIHPGYNMIGNPFPSTFKLNDPSWGTYWEDLVAANKAAANNSSATADKIEVWHENGDGEYDTYFLFYTTKKAQSTRNYKWVNASGAIWEGDFAPLGMGMYYKCLGTGYTLQMPRPFAK